jgi:hypothetical protein
MWAIGGGSLQSPGRDPPQAVDDQDTEEGKLPFLFASCSRIVNDALMDWEILRTITVDIQN